MVNGPPPSAASSSNRYTSEQTSSNQRTEVLPNISVGGSTNYSPPVPPPNPSTHTTYPPPISIPQTGNPRDEPASRAPSSPPSPTPPNFHQSWDTVIRTFLRRAGLAQTLGGFEQDMLVLNPDWERGGVALALEELSDNLRVRTQFGFHAL